MTLKVALLMLAAWLFGVVVLGVYRIGILVHVLLLAAIMLLLAAALKALDAAKAGSDPPSGRR